MRITLQDLESYERCSLRFHLDRQAGRNPKEEGVIQRVESVIAWFFFQVMDGRLVSKAELMEYWNSLHRKGRRPKSVLYQGLDPDTQAMIKAMWWIEHFWDHIRKGTGRPLLVYQPFEAALGQGHRLVGRIPLVREVKEDGKLRIEIVDYRFEPYDYYRLFLKSKLDFTAYSLAFKQMFRSRETRIRIVNLPNNRQYVTFRTDDDHRRLKKMCRLVIQDMQQREPRPSQGSHCRTCPYQEPCLQWGGLNHGFKKQ